MKTKTKRGARRIRNQRVINRSKCHNLRTGNQTVTHIDIKFDKFNELEGLYDLAK